MSDEKYLTPDSQPIDPGVYPARYRSEAVFLGNILNNFHLPVSVFSNAETLPRLIFGAHGMFYGTESSVNVLNEFAYSSSPNTIYRLNDRFHYRYLFLRLPDTDTPLFMLIGPYEHQDITQQMILDLCDRFHLPAENYSNLDKFYKSLPWFPNENALVSMINSFGEVLWGDLDLFRIVDVDGIKALDLDSVAVRPHFKEPEEAFLTMEILEQRYSFENQLMLAVSQGQTHKAENLATNFTLEKLETRLSDPIRDVKNYSIILNTLLRKAAESGSVHPLHIDSLSSRYARRIEQINSVASGQALQNEMVRKYCLLVKNHSMRKYSLLIRKVLTRIDSDLTADLTLKTQAALLQVNASYLSSLFKKETGVTLTEYVNRKRVEQALFLLNSTAMQIQTIAAYCGIPDVNYFTKIFKKLIGKTPKEYREGISV